jgi:hypothetical protein
MNQIAPQSAGFPIEGAVVPVAAPTTIEYTLRPDDLAESFVYQAAQHPAIRTAGRRNSFRRQLWLLVYMVAPGWVAALIRSPHGSEPPGALIPVYVAIGLWLVICLANLLPRKPRKTSVADGYRPYYRRLAADPTYARLLGPYRLDLTAEGVTQASKLREVRVRWAGVNTIVAMPGVTYFDLGASGQMVVPSRAFSDDATYWAFVRQAREYKAAADGMEAP